MFKMQLQQSSLSRRAFLRWSAMGVGAAAIAACAPTVSTPSGESSGETAPAAATTTISFLTQGGADSEKRYIPLQEMFGEIDPNVTVEFIWHPGGAIEIQQKLLTMIAGGESPDLYWTHTYINPGLAKREVPLALDDLFAGDSSWSRDAYFPGSVADFQVAGKQYAMPRETTASVMIYNKTLIEESGAALPTPEWTWDDFVEIAKATTKGEGADKIYGVANFTANAYTFVRAWQKGGDILNEERTEYTFNEAPSVAGVQSIADLIHTDGVHVSGAELAGRPYAEVFLTGKIAMFPQFSVFTAILPAEFEWDIAHMPHNADEARTTRVASAGHSIYSGTQQVDAAWSWLRFLESKEAFEHLAATGLSVPAHKEVAESPLYLSPDQPPASKDIFLEALNYGRPEPVAGDWIGVHREITTALEGVYGVSQRPVQEALDSIADLVNELIAAEPTAA
ncbi:MAG: sugar ABC transporter substrate-binding protein [Caldilineaceae bacterium]|nr:sugar ABC transporter substrate-binding protein [Caldilineaceae bacterium]